MTVGTPNFMPPEQWRGDPVTPAADQYALAVIVYNILTGKLPFEGDTPFVLMHKHLNEYPTPPNQRRIDLPPHLTPILLRAMAKNPPDRFANCTEFANALSAVASGNVGMMTNPYQQPPMQPKTPPNMVYQTPPPPYQTPPPTPYGVYPPSAPKKQNNALIGALVGIALLVIIGVLVVIMGQGGDNSSANITTTATSAAVVILPTDTDLPAITDDDILSPTDAPTLSPIPTETPLPTHTDAPTETSFPPTWTPVPTSTSEPTAIPSDTPEPTVDVLAVVARMDATSTAENILKLTATALSWTDTPTLDVSATINAIMADRTATQSAIDAQTATQLAINRQTEIALSWTPTPSATMTLRPTSTPRPTDTPFPLLTASFVAELIDPWTVYIEATATGGTGDYGYTWDFGDGTIAEDADSAIYHTYQFAGTYTITLTVSDGRDYQFAQTTITIDPPTPTLALGNHFDGVNLVFAIPDYASDYFGDVLDQFTAETGITVELTSYSGYTTTIQTMIVTGVLPDVFWMAGELIDTWANTGVLFPVTGLIDDEADFFPTTLESARVGNDYYCIPRDFSTLALLYNPAWFDEMGFAYPTHDWTWDDLINHAYLFYEAKGEPTGLYIDNYFGFWLPYIYQAGGRIYDIDTGVMSFDSPEVLTGIQFLMDLRSASSTTQDIEGWSGSVFGENQVAMVVNGSWMFSAMSGYPNVEMRSVQLPSGVTEGSISFNTCYSISGYTPYPEASLLLANFLARPDIQSQLISSSAIPSRMSVAEDYVHYWLNYSDQGGFTLSRETIEAFIIAAYDAVPYKVPDFNSFPSYEIESILQSAFNGEISAEEAQEMMQALVGN